MNWNDSRRRHPPAKPQRRRNRGVEQLTREIRDIRGFLRIGADTIRQTFVDDAIVGAPMDAPAARSDEASAPMNDPTFIIQRLTVQATELRAEVAALGFEVSRCGQAYVELLEATAGRLDTLVTPARYRR